MKNILILFLILQLFSPTFAMEHIKRELLQLRQAGATPEDIAHVATNTLADLLEHGMLRALIRI